MKVKAFCNYPWTHFEVNNPNGDVTMCCDSHIVLGNVNKQSIAEIWNGEGYRKIRNDMLLKGAHAVCSSECAVLKGFKSYQNLDWYKNLEKNSPLFLNAQKNDNELSEGKLTLDSMPRWMRFAHSYVCNLNCYHCYQAEIRKEKLSLPGTFIHQVFELSYFYQVLFYYGGEPFLYEPTRQLLKSQQVNPHCRHFFVTNATLLNNELFETLQQKEIGLISCSLDAANGKTYAILRKGGNWQKVLQNLERISEMKKTKKFVFSIALTVNSLNALELEKFCDMGISLGAEPMITLVNNPFGSMAFQRRYLHFSASLVTQIMEQIDRSIKKLKANDYKDAKIIWQQTRQRIWNHFKNDNNLFRFYIKKKVYDILKVSPISKRLINIMKKTKETKDFEHKT
jgi:sulfatase maturation enzyme AslB (radical SAM superfamily)